MGWKCWIAIGLVLQMLAFVPAAWNALYPEPVNSQGQGVVIDFIESVSKRDRVVVFLGFALVCLGSVFQIIGLLRSP